MDIESNVRPVPLSILATSIEYRPIDTERRVSNIFLGDRRNCLVECFLLGIVRIELPADPTGC